MRWARTGARVPWGDRCADWMAGLLWYVGLFVALGALAYVVGTVIT
jgi:hypothetical protein